MRKTGEQDKDLEKKLIILSAGTRNLTRNRMTLSVRPFCLFFPFAVVWPNGMLYRRIWAEEPLGAFISSFNCTREEPKRDLIISNFTLFQHHECTFRHRWINLNQLECKISHSKVDRQKRRGKLDASGAYTLKVLEASSGMVEHSKIEWEVFKLDRKKFLLKIHNSKIQPDCFSFSRMKFMRLPDFFIKPR